MPIKTIAQKQKHFEHYSDKLTEWACAHIFICGTIEYERNSIDRCQSQHQHSPKKKTYSSNPMYTKPVLTNIVISIFSSFFLLFTIRANL